MCSTHTTENCYWPGGGKEGQFPPNFGQRSKANSAILSSRETTQHFALSTWIFKQHRTSNTVSEILIDNSDERSHHTSTNVGDNIPLFDDGSRNVLVGRERENLAEKVDEKVDKEEKVNEKVNKEGNQPIPLDKPEPDINQLNTLHTEEDSTEVASDESGEDEDEVDWGIGTIDEHPKGVDKDKEAPKGTTQNLSQYNGRH